jgi:hypothetical protein
MPRVGFSIAEQSSSFDGVVKQIGEYARQNAAGDIDVAFAKPTGHGLFIGIGDSEFMFSQFTDPADSEEDLTASGLFSFDQLRDLDLPKPDPVVEDLMFEGETIALAGRPKVGKTRLVHHCALSIARGTQFLGMKTPRPRRVLIIDLENRPWAIRDRLLRMAGDGPKPHGLYLWCTNSLTTDVLNATAQGIAKLKELLERTAAEVVIIDPWRLWLGGDENNAGDVVGGLRELSKLRETNPTLTIIIVHHVRKDRFESPRNLLTDSRSWIESVSGHYALASHVDACFGLERQRDDKGEEFIVFGGIARNTEPRTILLDEDEETLRFEVRQGHAVMEAVLTPKEREIWQVASKMKGDFRFTDLITAAHVTNKKAVSSMLKTAIAGSEWNQWNRRNYPLDSINCEGTGNGTITELAICIGRI